MKTKISPSPWGKGRIGAILVLLLFLASVCWAQSSTVVISQVYGGGGASTGTPTYKNDYVELHNLGGASVTLTGWSIQYGSAAGSAGWNVAALPAGLTIAPGQYLLIQEGAAGSAGGNFPVTPDATGGLNLSATSGKVALVNGTTPLSGACPASATIVDKVGFGTANCSETAPTAVLTNASGAVRNGAGCTDTDNNSADFTIVSGPVPRNGASAYVVCSGTTPPSGVGAASPSSVDQGASVLLTVTVTPGSNPASTGLAVQVDLTAIGGFSSQAFFDDGTNGDVTPNDNIFSYQTTVNGSTPTGSKTLPVTISDAQSRTGSAGIGLTVTVPVPVLNIHTIQGAGDTSPYVGQMVATTGIVTARKSNGFFIQNSDSDVDADPNTSEGLYVYTGSTPSTAAALGNLVRVQGTISEYQGSGNTLTLTELGSPVVTLMTTGNALPVPVTLLASDMPANGTLDQLEKYESMRVHADTLITICGTNGSVNEANATGSSNGIFYTLFSGTTMPHRDAGVEVGSEMQPLVPPATPLFSGNPQRLRIDTGSLTGSTMLDVTSNVTVSNVTGVLDYGWDAYTIDPDPSAPPTVSANIAASPLRAPGAREFTVASMNMQRFYNATADDAGAVVLTATAYARRLNKASLIVRNILNMPDLIGVVEIENQATIDDLANKINADAVAAGQADPQYVGYTFQGNDPSAIDTGLLVKSTRVTANTVTAYGLDTTYIDPATGSLALLNDRTPVVGKVTINRGLQTYPLTIVVNHLRSMSGYDVNTADGNRIRVKRAGQAEYLASLLAGFQTTGDNLVSVGDYNAYEVNDGLGDLIGTVIGNPTPATEVLIASPDLVDPNLTDLLATPAKPYTYTYNGNDQILDHIIADQALLRLPVDVQVAHVNADFPETYRSDGARPERLSDHDIPVAYFTLPAQADLGVAVPVQPEKWLIYAWNSYVISVSNQGPDDAQRVTVTQTLPSWLSPDFSFATGWSCAVGAGMFQCTLDSLANGSTAELPVEMYVDCTQPTGMPMNTVISVSSSINDINLANNTFTPGWTVFSQGPPFPRHSFPMLHDNGKSTPPETSAAKGPPSPRMVAPPCWAQNPHPLPPRHQ